MVIAIDGYEANVRNRVGIGRYAFQILTHIYEKLKEQRAKSKDEIYIRVYLPDQPLADLPKETEWWKYRIAKPKKFWTFIGLPLALLSDSPKPDVVFSPTHYIPRFIPYPKIMSIMDLSYLSYPEMFKKKDLHKLVYWTRYSASYASRILTISEYSKNAIIRAYRIDSKRIIVVYPGLTMSKASTISHQLSAIRSKYGIVEKYILSVGTIQPRKNFERLIAAYAKLINNKEYSDIELVIIGKKGWLYEDILVAPQKYNVVNRVKFLDFVPDSDLPAFYQNALCFALPSLYEGFGLPVLEAMANNCPVVVSNVSSLPEIAGKAGIYVDPTSVESIAHGLHIALTQKNSKEGKNRVATGLAQTKKFTWDNAARETLKVLTEVASAN